MAYQYKYNITLYPKERPLLMSFNAAILDVILFVNDAPYSIDEYYWKVCAIQTHRIIWRKPKSYHFA